MLSKNVQFIPSLLGESKYKLNGSTPSLSTLKIGFFLGRNLEIICGISRLSRSMSEPVTLGNDFCD